jgi:predicted branched-subunit amino acid permease
LKIWGITDTGLVRKENQDAYGVIERTESGHTVCVVCDGMGGAAAGNILPNSVTGALGIALYAMFIAIIIPPSLQRKGILCAVSVAGVFSVCFYYLPVFSNISSGLSVIIIALATALVVAAIFPIKEKQGAQNETD